MKTKCFLSLVLLLLCMAGMAQTGVKCLYISAENGATVYQNNSVKSKAIKQLQYGALVKVEEYTTDSATVKINGKKIKSCWLKISLKDEPTNDTEEQNNKPTGFILEAYTHPYLKKIPGAVLGDYQSISFKDVTITKTDGGYTSPHNLNHDADSVLCGCFDYFSSIQPVMQDNSGNNTLLSLTDSKLDTVKHYLQVTLVDINKYKWKKINPFYTIDISTVIIPVDDISREGKYRYYLPINSGNDSVLINEAIGEYGSYYSYLGQIEKLNKYLLRHESFFDNSTLLIDRTTGKETYFTAGNPQFSPNGKYVVDFYASYDYELEEVYGTPFTISVLGDSVKLDFKLTVHFGNFVTNSEAFWVSDNELIMGIMPIDNPIYQSCFNEALVETKPQYIKVKIFTESFMGK